MKMLRTWFLVGLPILLAPWQVQAQGSLGSGSIPHSAQSERVEKPQIPAEDFERNGTFKVPGEAKPVTTDLTIRGKWQNGYFNLYLQQGSKKGKYWVENLIYRNHLYTITHKWPNFGLPVTRVCYKSRNKITADGLNALLMTAQLVGLETIDGTAMNHFRVSCLSKTRIVGVPLPAVPLKVFSDIYVQPGHPQSFKRWLQFGDAVGLSKQNDEWFFFEEENNHPEEIRLPQQCVHPIQVRQQPCSNLSSLIRSED